MNNYETGSLTFDPEADMFAAYAPEAEILREIAGMIIDLNENRELLDKAIQYAKENGSFE